MTLPKPNFSYADYLKLPDDQRYEVLEGELVMSPGPSMEHQGIVAVLTALLYAYQREHGAGRVFGAPFDVILSEHNVVQPDLLFVCRDRSSILKPGGVHGAPDLVVEILSPSNAERDLKIKRDLYGRYGVKEYWIVDPATQTVEILTQQGDGLDLWQRFEKGSSLRSPLLAGLVVDLDEVFA